MRAGLIGCPRFGKTVVIDFEELIHNHHFHIICRIDLEVNKKLGYPQRKCASNVAILYGADGISI